MTFTIMSPGRRPLSRANYVFLSYTTEQVLGPTVAALRAVNP